MSLRRRAVSGAILAGFLVVMCAGIDTAGTVTGEKAAQAAVVAPADATAGVVVSLDQVRAEAFDRIEEASAGIEQTRVDVVASAQEAEEAVSAEEVLDHAELQAADSAVQEEMTETAMPDAAAEEAEAAEENAAQEASPEEEVWQNRLMADVEEFLYVRAEGNPEAEIVGKLYQGDVAEILEEGEAWTYISSGNVSGFVKNDYCVTGDHAYRYAAEHVETEAEIQTDGLRVRSEADENAKVLTAVSTGATLIVDTDADSAEGWLPVKYGEGTAYVSEEYVKTDFALGEAVTIEEEKAALARKAEEEAKAAQASGAEKVQNAAVAASVDEVTLLAALIQCEAGNECYEGQLAVGAVVMNRVRSGRYPGSIHAVIYQGGQFTPAGSGAVANTAANGPKASCVQAAQEALAGADNTGGATSFRRASSGIAGVVIGNHVFF